MQTECSADLFGFARVGGRAVVAAFAGGKITSDGGALVLGATDRAVRLIERFAGCFLDDRAAELVEHEVATLVGQGVFGIKLLKIGALVRTRVAEVAVLDRYTPHRRLLSSSLKSAQTCEKSGLEGTHRSVPSKCDET